MVVLTEFDNSDYLAAKLGTLTRVTLPAIPTIDQTYVLIHSRRQFLNRLKRQKYNSVEDLRSGTSFSSYSYWCEFKCSMFIFRLA